MAHQAHTPPDDPTYAMEEALDVMDQLKNSKLFAEELKWMSSRQAAYPNEALFDKKDNVEINWAEKQNPHNGISAAHRKRKTEDTKRFLSKRNRLDICH